MAKNDPAAYALFDGDGQRSGREPCDEGDGRARSSIPRASERALRIDPLRLAAIVVASVNLAGALRSPPGQMGVFEGGASLGLMMTGIPSAAALASRWLYWRVLWLPGTALAGLMCVGRPAAAVGTATAALARNRVDTRARAWHTASNGLRASPSYRRR
jgi:hypothetical protein